MAAGRKNMRVQMIATRSRSPTNYLTGLDIVDSLLELEHQQRLPEWYDGWETVLI